MRGRSLSATPAEDDDDDEEEEEEEEEEEPEGFSDALALLSVALVLPKGMVGTTESKAPNGLDQLDSEEGAGSGKTAGAAVAAGSGAEEVSSGIFTALAVGGGGESLLEEEGIEADTASFLRGSSNERRKAAENRKQII